MEAASCISASILDTSIAKRARFMGPTWGPPGSCRPQIGPCWPHEPCSLGRWSIGVSPSWCQSTIETNMKLSSSGHLEENLAKFELKYNNCNTKETLCKWRPFCLVLAWYDTLLYQQVMVLLSWYKRHATCTDCLNEIWKGIDMPS